MIWRLHLAILASAVASLACTLFVGGPALPDPPISSSPEALGTLQGEVEKALVESLTDGVLRLTITQEQLTAYLASRLGSQEHPILTMPQVSLGDQEMILYGRTRAWIFEANAAVAARFSIGDSGVPEISISRAQVGPLPMPGALREAVASAMDEALTGYLGPAALGFRLESVDISSGIMTITGRVR